MAGEIFAGISGVSGLLGIVRAMKDANDTVTRNTVALELQEKLIVFHERYSAMSSEVEGLKSEIARLKNWEAEKARYNLKDIGGGTLAYSLKVDMKNDEPDHSLCPDCYQRGSKSIVQSVTKYPGMAYVVQCQQCGWEAYLHGQWMPEHGGKKSPTRR